MKSIITYIMDIGEQMLVSGAEVHRVEMSINRMCEAYGFLRTDVFIITSSMVVTVYAENEVFFTQTRRIFSHNVDYEKLHRLNDLCRRICDTTPKKEDLEVMYKEALETKKYPFWLEVICYSAIAGAFTLFFGGSALEFAVSLLIGGITRFVLLLSEKTVLNKFFSKFICSVAVTALAFIVVKIGIVGSADKLIIGNIMTLIPGVGLTNSLRDLFTGDSVSGLLRFIEAMLIALSIAAGYFLVALLGGVLL